MSISITNDPNQGYYTELIDFEGFKCRKIPEGKDLYFQIDRSAVPSTARNLLISVTYFDNNSRDISFQYNAVGTGDAAAFKSANFTKGNSQTWVTTVVTISDAELSGKMFGSDDIRIGGLNYIKEVKVAIGSLNPDTEPVPQPINTASNQYTGRSFAGYQIWHKAGPTPEDWNHWSPGRVPGPGFHMYNGVDVSTYPDVSEYDEENLFHTNLGALGNGREAGLYHAMNPAIINKQMEWLETAGFDGVGIGRFVGNTGKSITLSENSHLTSVKNACEATGRLFFVGYDMNGSDNTIVECMKKDWVYEIEQIRALTSSPNYATVNGKPVVLLWGIGMDMITVPQCEAIIDFLHSRGCYIIGGISRDWRSEPAEKLALYKKLDSISPWTVGAYGDSNGANNYKNNYMIGDKQFCDNNNIDYLPVVFPGSANWLNENLQLSQNFRKGGELFWTQISNAQSVGVTSVYYAMLDEFEESTNYIKGAVDYFDLPTGQYFETFSRDGIWVSSDYYLRLGAHASKVLRGEEPFTTEISIPYSEGPVYYRNSFESRLSTMNINARGKGPGEAPDYETILPIDPCFYRPQLLANTNVKTPSCKIEKTSVTKSGDYSVHFSGEANSGQTARYAYKFAEVKIPVVDGMKFSFWKYTENEPGQYTSVDLLFKSGKQLSNLPAFTDNNGVSMHPGNARGTIGEWNLFSCVFGKDELLGDTIAGIVITYDHPQLSGRYSAYFDNIIISDGSYETAITMPQNRNESTNIYAYNGEIILKNQTHNASVRIYNIAGQNVFHQNIQGDQISIRVDKGMYVVLVNNNGKVERKKVIVY
ncbi:hypothetical protein FACS189421_02180 [Bacteroidia bacterium]|nr:hypothetical protein FACS189421_02180 [Bacteroidia bacterium]